jgi:hypothetical protein
MNEMEGRGVKDSYDMNIKVLSPPTRGLKIKAPLM